MTITLLGALVGGVLTLLSPCSVILLPAFFAYAFTSARQILSRTGIFFLGLLTTLLPLGVLASTLGLWLQQFRVEVVIAAAILVIVFGAIMLFGIPIPGLVRQRGANTASLISVYSLGMIYGLAGVCAGPLLGAVLTVAGLTANPISGGLLMFAFATGMALPLVILALVWERMPWVRRLVRPRELVIGRWRNAWTQIVGGLIMIAVGVLMLVTDGTATLVSLVTVEQQFALETSLMRATDKLPATLSAVIAGVVLVGVWMLVWLRSRASRTKQSE